MILQVFGCFTGWWCQCRPHNASCNILQIRRLCFWYWQFDIFDIPVFQYHQWILILILIFEGINDWCSCRRFSKAFNQAFSSYLRIEKNRKYVLLFMSMNLFPGEHGMAIPIGHELRDWSELIFSVWATFS